MDLCDEFSRFQSGKDEVEPSLLVDMEKGRVQRKSHSGFLKHKYHSVCPNVSTHHQHPQVLSL